MADNALMGRLLKVFLAWALRHLVLLAIIMGLLVAVPLLLSQWHALAGAEARVAELARSAAAIAQSGVQARQQLQGRIPEGQQLEPWQQLAQGLDTELAAKRQAHAQLLQQNPLQSRVLGSAVYQQVKVLELEIALLEQGRAYAASVLTVVQGLAAGQETSRAQLALCLRQVAVAEDALYDNRLSQWQLSKDFPLAWQVPGTAIYQQMKMLERQQRELAEATRAAHQRCDTLKLVQDEKDRVAAYIAPFDPSTSPADHAVQELTTARLQLEAQGANSWLRQAADAAQRVWPVAAGVLLAIILAPVVIKLLFYFVLAPLAARRAPVCLLPGSGVPADPPKSGGTGGRISAVSQSIVLRPGEVLWVHPAFLQSAALAAPKTTQWLLSWRMPLSSLAAGLYALTRIEAAGDEPVVVSATRDPLSEIGRIDLPEGAALVLQPRNLVGLVARQGAPLRITRHWRLGHLHSWLTLQLRYLVFHGPATLLVQGCRGVRMERPAAGRAINQALTMGFSANLHYGNTRCETFVAYWMGQQDLFNDRFASPVPGEGGWYVYEEMLHPERKTGITGRGLEGLSDALLKALGI